MASRYRFPPWPRCGHKKLGQIKNIRFSNIIAESESGIVVWGSKNSVIKDLAFDNVKVKIKNGPLSASYAVILTCGRA